MMHETPAPPVCEICGKRFKTNSSASNERETACHFREERPSTGDGVVQSGLDDIFYVSRPSRSRQRKDTGEGLSLDVLHE